MNLVNRRFPHMPAPRKDPYGSELNHQRLQAEKARTKVEAAIKAVESYRESHNVSDEPDSITVSSFPISSNGKPFNVWSLSNRSLSLGKRLAGALGFGPSYDLLNAKLEYAKDGSVKSFHYEVRNSDRGNKSRHLESGFLSQDDQDLKHYSIREGSTYVNAISGRTECHPLSWHGNYREDEFVSGGGAHMDFVMLDRVHHFYNWRT